MQQPPLLPEQVLARVHRLARRNGMSILIVAAIAAVLQAAGHDQVGAITGVLAAGTGAMEVHGAGLLRSREEQGIYWMIRAELLLLLVLLAYCAVRLAFPNYDEMRAAFHATLELPGMREKWEEARQLGVTEDMYLGLVHRLTFIVLSVVSLIYQGGMAIYYNRKRGAVARAIADA